MNPTMRQLEALVMVYRLGSLTKAAAELRVTQSAISLLIRQIEENFQLKLFDRTTRALHPTPGLQGRGADRRADTRRRPRVLGTCATWSRSRPAGSPWRYQPE